jgi:hypothetical protein
MAVGLIFPTRVRVLSSRGHFSGVSRGVGSTSKRRTGHENPARSPYSTVPQTDTGGRVEDTKAFEITIVKELGKMAP